ncbi:MAG: hypothetical protein IJ214_12350 [Clostridia bacterium]|nr:hypothetical protein [Clostridia bacterium]
MLIDFLLRQKCVVRPWLRTEDGRDIYADAQTRSCRLQAGRYLENGAGVDGVSDAVTARAMLFCTGEMIPERSLVECEGRTYIVLSCRAARGWGQEHLEVTLQ